MHVKRLKSCAADAGIAALLEPRHLCGILASAKLMLRRSQKPVSIASGDLLGEA